MARARLIRPGFWNDEKLARLSRDARLIFAGLWSTSDDYGVSKANAIWLKSQIFPYDDIPIKKFKGWLDDLEDLGRLWPFEANGESYYFIPKFKDHQKIHNPSKYRNPSPPETLGINPRKSEKFGQTCSEIKLIKSNLIESNLNKEKSSTKVDPNHNLFVKYYCKEYEKKFGIKYAFDGGRDAKTIKTLLTQFDYDTLCKMAVLFFADTSDFVKGHTVGKFKFQAQGLAEELKNPKPESPTSTKNLAKYLKEHCDE